MAAEQPHDLVERWVRVWMHSRKLTSTLVDGWPLVRVGSQTRETELICVEPGLDVFTSLMSHIAGNARAMLTVITRDAGPYDAVPLPTDVRVDRGDETLMVTDLPAIDTSPIDARFTTRWDILEHRATYAVECAGQVAAEGTVGVLGDDATFDAVETTRDFRRRGLGRHVMATLMAYALERGARHGVLAATPEGRRLYEALGWTRAYEMRSLMGVG